MRLRKRHSDLPPDEYHHVVDVPRKISERPSPSKSPTASLSSGSDALNLLAYLISVVGGSDCVCTASSPCTLIFSWNLVSLHGVPRCRKVTWSRDRNVFQPMSNRSPEVPPYQWGGLPVPCTSKNSLFFQGCPGITQRVTRL